MGASASFDDFVGGGEERWRNFETERLGRVFAIPWHLRVLLDSDATPREAIDRLVEAAFDQIRETRTEYTLVHTVRPSVI